MTRLKVGDIAIAPENCADYLTPKKEYEIETVNYRGNFHIKSDENCLIFCLQENCSHINNQNWTFKTK